jgi:hypothetical protein
LLLKTCRIARSWSGWIKSRRGTRVRSRKFQNRLSLFTRMETGEKVIESSRLRPTSWRACSVRIRSVSRRQLCKKIELAEETRRGWVRDTAGKSPRRASASKISHWWSQWVSFQASNYRRLLFIVTQGCHTALRSMESIEGLLHTPSFLFRWAHSPQAQVQALICPWGISGMTWSLKM